MELLRRVNLVIAAGQGQTPVLMRRMLIN